MCNSVYVHPCEEEALLSRRNGKGLEDFCLYYFCSYEGVKLGAAIADINEIEKKKK